MLRDKKECSKKQRVIVVTTSTPGQLLFSRSLQLRKRLIGHLTSNYSLRFSDPLSVIAGSSAQVIQSEMHGRKGCRITAKDPSPLVIGISRPHLTLHSHYRAELDREILFKKAFNWLLQLKIIFPAKLTLFSSGG